MKTIFRNLAFGAVMTGVALIGGTTAFGQDVCAEVEAKQALYKQFTDNFDKTIDKKKVAVDAGKQYVQKYGACADDKAIVDYLNANVPGMEKAIADEEAKKVKGALYGKFDTDTKGKNVAGIFSSGKEILAKEPKFVDVAITLAAAGFEQTLATPPVSTYNEEVVSYANNVIQQIESGTTPKNYGFWSYTFVNPKYPDTKSNTLGAMNYMIGFIKYFRQNQKKEALPYFYKATQFNSFSKTDPSVYQAIGAWYLEEAIKIDKDRQVKLTAAGNKDTDETLAMVGLQKGYADRSIDAYARAYKLAKDDKNQKKEYVDGLYKTLKDLFAFRFDNKTEGVDAYVASVMSKPLVDPTTAVTPVKEETPVTNTSSSTSSTTTTVTTSTPVKTATTDATLSGTKTTTTVTSTTATTKPKTTKPVVTPKKKGTR